MLIIWWRTVWSISNVFITIQKRLIWACFCRIVVLLCPGFKKCARLPDVTCSCPPSGTLGVRASTLTLFQRSCKCRRSTDVQDRWAAAVEDWCSVQIGVHDTGSWCSCPCGFLPAYQRGVGWQVPMMQHEPWCVPGCPADGQSQISWIYTWRTFGFSLITAEFLWFDPFPSCTFQSRGNSGVFFTISNGED